MLVANTIINSTQAAMGLTKAAVGLGQAIGEYHDQQANLAIQTVSTQYQAGVTEAVTNGYDPYVVETLQDGKQVRRYIGYDNYQLSDGKTLGEIKNEAVKTVGEKYWTDNGADRGMQIAVNAFDNIELAAQRQTADAVIKNRQNVFNQELTNAISEYQRTGDSTQINQVMEGATWMTEDQKQAETLDAFRTAQYGNVKNTALSIAGSQGIDKADEYLKTLPDAVSDDERLKILAEGQQLVTQTAGTKTAAAKEKYQQSIQSGSTIGNAYRAATANPGENAVVNEAVKQAAQTLQARSLSDKFGEDLAGSEAMTVQQLENTRRTYENRRSDYQDQGTLYKAHLDQIDNAIARKKAQEAAIANSANSGSGNDRVNAENYMANIFVDFNSRKTTGPEALKSIAQIRELSPLKAEEYEAKIIGNASSPAAQQAYTALTTIINANRPGDKASPQEKMDYEADAQNAREAVFQAVYEGKPAEHVTALLDGYRNDVSSKILGEAFRKGDIGESGFFGSAGKTAAAFAYHSNLGNLDLRYSERTRDAQRPDSTTTLTIGGARADTVIQQVADENMGWANKQLERKGIQMINADYDKDSEGDRNGSISYRGNDGNTYRVNAGGEKGNRFIEQLVDGRWVRVDVSKLPNVSRANIFPQDWKPVGTEHSSYVTDRR